MRTAIKLLGIYFLGVILFSSCKKSDFLTAKPSSSLVVPSTLKDFQALLDYDVLMNLTSSLGESSSDNYYMVYSFYQTLSPKDRNAYVWASDVYQGAGSIPDWNTPYRQILTANEVLEGVEKIDINNSNQQSWNLIKGSALFFRAYSYYHMAQVFAPPYDNSSANTDLGLPLKTSSDINVIANRSTVQQTYDQIIGDLNKAEPLLPLSFDQANRNRPSKLAVQAFLARIYMSMRNYTKAGTYADSVLQVYNTLINYNTVPISTAPYNPFARLNTETIFQSTAIQSQDVFLYMSGLSNLISVDTLLYRSYASNDLRKPIYYNVFANGSINTNSGYFGSSRQPFTGLATDELYLIRAECSARNNNSTAAMSDLNTLLQNRWKTGTFVPLTAANSSDALKQILTERRKELIFRGRWTDLRRLNKDGANIALTRILNGITYTLPPNSLLYVLPIPPDEIALSGIQQNQR